MDHKGVDTKISKLETKMDERFIEANTKITELEGKVDKLESKMDQRFFEVNQKLDSVLFSLVNSNLTRYGNFFVHVTILEISLLF